MLAAVGVVVPAHISKDLLHSLGLSPCEEVKAEVVEDPCKCEARLVFQKQTQATLQQLTAKHILPVVSDGRPFTVNILRSTLHQAPPLWLSASLVFWGFFSTSFCALCTQLRKRNVSHHILVCLGESFLD